MVYTNIVMVNGRIENADFLRKIGYAQWFAAVTIILFHMLHPSEKSFRKKRSFFKKSRKKCGTRISAVDADIFEIAEECGLQTEETILLCGFCVDLSHVFPVTEVTRKRRFRKTHFDHLNGGADAHR